MTRLGSLTRRAAVLSACVVISALAAGRVFGAEPAPARQPRDAFYWLSELNKAATVMVVETRIVPRPLGATIAESVVKVIARADADRKLRSGDYLQVEPLLIEEGGPDVTRLHSGRSRQEIGAVTRRLTQRDAIPNTMASLDRARAALLTFAAASPDALVPAYTHGASAKALNDVFEAIRTGR